MKSTFVLKINIKTGKAEWRAGGGGAGTAIALQLLLLGFIF